MPRRLQFEKSVRFLYILLFSLKKNNDGFFNLQTLSANNTRDVYYV
jgi:hypothetical protein